MADILDQKEEVINIELTPYGRKKIALGYFQPKYYSFFDDSIIYDYSYANVNSEDQNDIQMRILDQSLTHRSINLTSDTLRDKLGTSDTMSEYAPAWTIDILKGKINYNQISSSYYRKRFDTKDIVYYIELPDKDKMPIITSDYLLLEIAELNVDDDYNNFEIELFTYDELTGGVSSNFMRKLHFFPKQTNVIDDIIYDPSELSSNYYDINITRNDARFYVDILVDEEIDQDFIDLKEKTISEKAKSTYQPDYTGPIDPKC